MESYRITVTRYVVQTLTVDVEAADEERAEAIAFDDARFAGDAEWKTQWDELSDNVEMEWLGEAA